MKIILVFVTTLDGKVTKWGYPIVKSWSSSEDQEYFSAIMKNNRHIILGSSTFNSDPIKPSPGIHMLVMTREPAKYEQYVIPGRLEFTNQSPSEIVRRFKNEGDAQIAVVGGAQVATSFLKEELIDELWLTIEPRIFGTGGNFVTDEELDIRLRLISFEKVNDEGTLIVKYKVLKAV